MSTLVPKLSDYQYLCKLAEVRKVHVELHASDSVYKSAQDPSQRSRKIIEIRVTTTGAPGSKHTVLARQSLEGLQALNRGSALIRDQLGWV